MNPRTLRDAWTLITADDYDRHMASVGQAEANADIVRELFETRPPAVGAAILFVGAGTGQMFDFVSPDFLRPFSTTFTDINERYLRKLRGHLRSCPGVRAQAVVDDIENSALRGSFALIIAVLVLEHVDVARAVAAMCRLASERVFVVLQENPADLPQALTREPVGSMAVFRELQPHLVSSVEIERCFAAQGFCREWTTSRSVLDQKKLVGIEFRRRS